MNAFIIIFLSLLFLIITLAYFGIIESQLKKDFFYSILTLMAVFILFGYFNKDNAGDKKIIEIIKFSNEYPDKTINSSINISKYLNKKIDKKPSGVYEGSFKAQNYDATIRYYFNNESEVIKELFISYRKLFVLSNVINLSGHSKYSIDGSVLKFDESQGSLMMFPREGEAIESKDDHIVINIFNYIESENITGVEKLTLHRKEM